MQKKVILLFFVIMLLFFNIISLNAQEKVLEYFVNGNKYVNMGFTERESYLVGLMDAFYCILIFYGPKSIESCDILFALEYQEILEKTDAMTSDQLVKIVDKYYEEHPENLHYPVSSIFNLIFDSVLDD